LEAAKREKAHHGGRQFSELEKMLLKSWRGTRPQKRGEKGVQELGTSVFNRIVGGIYRLWSCKADNAKGYV